MADHAPPVDRIPIARSIVYAVRGMPEIADEYNAERTIAPTEISLTYRAAADERLGRVHAYVKGWWMQDGQRVPMDKPVGRHMYGDPEAWPAWLAEEARLHDPSASAQSAPANRADILREVADICDETGAAYAAKALNDHADGAFTLMERFQRKANEAEYVATPCDPMVACEDGGEPCHVHERLMAHAEGDHELCAPDCGTAAASSPQPEAQTAPPADDYEATTGHLITCFAVAGGNPDPDCPCAVGARQPGIETPTVPCSWVAARSSHTPHTWAPQPGMDPVPCAGYTPPVTDQPTVEPERSAAADTDGAHVAPHCDGFPTTCPNPVTVPPAPPHHGGGIRCGCYDEEQPS